MYTFILHCYWILNSYSCLLHSSSTNSFTWKHCNSRSTLADHLSRFLPSLIKCVLRLPPTVACPHARCGVRLLVHMSDVELCCLSTCQMWSLVACPHVRYGVRLLVHMPDVKFGCLSTCQMWSLVACPHARCGVRLLVHMPDVELGCLSTCQMWS